jgi:hypothetical protein
VLLRGSSRRGGSSSVTRVLERGWGVPMAAEAQGYSFATGYKWVRRFQAKGIAGLLDRSSRPLRSPMRLSPARERATVAYRMDRLEGPHRIAWALGEAPATVHRVLRRGGIRRLRGLDRDRRDRGAGRADLGAQSLSTGPGDGGGLRPGAPIVTTSPPPGSWPVGQECGTPLTRHGRLDRREERRLLWQRRPVGAWQRRARPSRVLARRRL